MFLPERGPVHLSCHDAWAASCAASPTEFLASPCAALRSRRLLSLSRQWQLTRSLEFVGTTNPEPACPTLGYAPELNHVLSRRLKGTLKRGLPLCFFSLLPPPHQVMALKPTGGGREAAWRSVGDLPALVGQAGLGSCGPSSFPPSLHRVHPATARSPGGSYAAALPHGCPSL